MNSYPHHIGDYATGTPSFTALEHGVYRLLMDAYYSAEEGPLAEDVYGIAKAGTAVERKAVDKVLARKFKLKEGRYYHDRIETEIAIYKAKAEANRRNGKRGGRPPEPKPNPQITQVVSIGIPKQEPKKTLANSQEPIKPNPVKEQQGSGDIPADPGRVAALLALCASQRVETPDARAKLHVRQWAAEGVTEGQLADAITIGRERVGTKPLRVAYLVPIVSDLVAGTQPARTYDADDVASRAMAAIAAKEGNATH